MSKINSSKTAGTVLAELRMLRAGGYNGIFAVVEGPDDFAFWKLHLKIPQSAIVQSEGVINLRGCMEKLPNTLAASVFAVADRDFAQHLSVDPFAKCTNTFFYDEGFLETFLVNSSALSRIILHHGIPDKISQFQKTFPPGTIYTYARKVATVFGKLRIINEKHQLGVCFKKKFTPYKYLCGNSWAFDQLALITDFAKQVGWPTQRLQNELATFGDLSTLQFVHGHDLIKIFVVGLKKPVGKSAVGEDSIIDDFMLAFHSSNLQYKILIKELRQWAGVRALI